MSARVELSGAGGEGATLQQEFERKIAYKFFLRRWLGEIYIGKRMKQHSLARWLAPLTPPAGGRVLEVGSEDGCFTEWIARSWPQTTVEGLELDPLFAMACARWASDNGRSPKLSFRAGDLRELGGEGCYDRIFCLDVLGYIPDDGAALRKLRGALKVGGKLIIHQPNRFYREFGGRVHEVSPQEAGKITEGHLRHGYTMDELRSLLTSAGFRVEVLEPWHGAFSDLAHRLYRMLENPNWLRIIALPMLDALWLVDSILRWHVGNTVFAVARNEGVA